MPTEIKGTATDSQWSCGPRCDVCGFSFKDCQEDLKYFHTLYRPLHAKFQGMKTRLATAERKANILNIALGFTLVALAWVMITLV